MLFGTTLRKCIKYIEESLGEKIKKVEMRSMFEEEIVKSREAIMFGGDKVIPILQFEDKDIGDGKKGEVTGLI